MGQVFRFVRGIIRNPGLFAWRYTAFCTNQTAGHFAIRRVALFSNAGAGPRNSLPIRHRLHGSKKLKGGLTNPRPA